MQEIKKVRVYEKVPSAKENLLTAIREGWNHLDKELFWISEIDTWKN